MPDELRSFAGKSKRSVESISPRGNTRLSRREDGPECADPGTELARDHRGALRPNDRRVRGPFHECPPVLLLLLSFRASTRRATFVRHSRASTRSRCPQSRRSWWTMDRLMTPRRLPTPQERDGRTGKSNQGLSAARNQGLRLANAPYVVFLDADDELERDAVESGVAALERRPDAWMVGRYCVLIDPQGRPCRRTPWREDRRPLRRVACAQSRLDSWRRRVPSPAAPGHRWIPTGAWPCVGLCRLPGTRPRRARDLRFASSRALSPARLEQFRDAIVMLNATMAVLRRERPHVPAPHRQQFRRGLDAWRIYYGDQIIQQLRADVRNGAIGRPQLNAIAVLLKQCRGLVLTHLRRKISRLIRGLPPAVIEPGRFETSPESVEPLSHSDVPR